MDNRLVQTSLNLVVKNCMEQSLPHVLHRIDEFLTPFIYNYVFAEACEEGVSEHTLEFLFQRVAPKWDAAVCAAARGGHVHVLEWITGIKDDRGPWKAEFENFRSRRPAVFNVFNTAATYGHLNVIEWLCERGERLYALLVAHEFPEKYWQYWYYLSIPLVKAVRNGRSEMVQWIANNRSGECSRLKRKRFDEAVENGHVAIAQFLYEIWGEICSFQAIDKAAMNGHIEMLQWLQSTGLLKCTEDAMDGAAGNGHLEVVKWLHENSKEGCSGDAILLAACSDHLEVVEWLYAHVDVKFCINGNILLSRCENLKVLQWIDTHFAEINYRRAITYTVWSGNLDILNWLRQCKNAGCTDVAPIAATLCGHLNVIQWLCTYYLCTFPWHQVLDTAAEFGHLEIVKWLHENNIGEWSTNAMDRAARAGHLDVVLYLLENRNEGFSCSAMTSREEFEVQCVFTSDTNSLSKTQVSCAQLKILQSAFKARPSFVRGCLRSLAEIAVHEGLIEILDWVKQFGLELYSTVPVLLAASRGDVRLLEWFYQNSFDVSDPELLEVAIESDRLDAAHWLFNHEHTIKPLDLDQVDNKKKNVPMLRWLVEHGPPVGLPIAMKLVMEFGYVEIVSWLSEDIRVQIVLEALQTDKRELLCWVLTRTEFECERSYRRIGDGVQRAPNKTMLWFQKYFADLTEFNWFPTIWQNEESENSTCEDTSP